MSRDRRKKGCPNEDCDMNKKKHKYSADDTYCPKCGTKLVFVCAKCFKKITEDNPNHRYCALCEAKHGGHKPVVNVKKAVDTVKHAGSTVGYTIKGIGINIKEALDDNDVVDDIKDVGAKVVKDVGTYAVKEAGDAAKNAIKKATHK